MFDALADYVHWCNDLLGLDGGDNLLPPILVTVVVAAVALFVLGCLAQLGRAFMRGWRRGGHQEHAEQDSRPAP